VRKGALRDTVFKGGGEGISGSEVRLGEGKALGSEKGKDLGSGLCYEYRREIE
jgi:hypothetical protein